MRKTFGIPAGAAVFLVAGMATLAGAAGAGAGRDDLARRAFDRRAVGAVVWGMPAANYDLMRQQMLDATDAEPNQVIYRGRPLDWMNQTLTPNPDTLYFTVFYDTHDGPVVREVPPAGGGSFNGNVVTAWQMPVEDLGLLGIDKGAGGKFRDPAAGRCRRGSRQHRPLRPDPYGGFALIRANLASHAPEEVAKAVAYGKRVQVYPPARPAVPPGHGLRRGAGRAGGAILVGHRLRPRNPCPRPPHGPCQPVVAAARAGQEPRRLHRHLLRPGTPAGQAANWIPTDPARGFEVMFRLYAPTPALFGKSWRLPYMVRLP